MLVEQTGAFRKIVKKLHKNQKMDLDLAVKKIMEDPYIGENKIGDLSFVKIYKFKMINQLTFLAYSYEKNAIILTFLYLGTHENFYRDVKK